MPPRLVRRKPLLDRITDYFNPADFLLWLSEEFETRDWDSKQLGAPLALGLHLLLLIARANAGRSSRSRDDDVFGDVGSGSGWLGYIASFTVQLLTLFSIFNAIYTFYRKRHYRLYESNIDTPMSTPSAHRVHVDSSPAASSPLRFLTSIIGDTSAESRKHPDPTEDVWAIEVWDPLPVCLRLFCFFSPGHVLVYWLFLPTLSSDPRPSITVITTIVLQLLMSSQLYLLRSNFSQQEKDTAIIHKEVMSEYDTKFVHPRLNPLVRDVGTQFTGPDVDDAVDGEVDTYTPTVILRRGFRTNPNPNYTKWTTRASSPAPAFTPSAYTSREPTPFTGLTPRTGIRQPQFRQSATGVSTSTGASTGDGGSLGIYSHANSPLKKATSMYDMQGGRRDMPKNSFDMATREIREERERSRSPTKRQSEAPVPLFPRGRSPFPEFGDGRRTSAPTASGPKQRIGNHDSPKSHLSKW